MIPFVPAIVLRVPETVRDVCVAVKSAATVLFALVVVTATGGCGTLETLFDSSTLSDPGGEFGPYSGVRHDASRAVRSYSPCRAASIVDLPFSAALDTALLPVSIPTAIIRVSRETSPATTTTR